MNELEKGCGPGESEHEAQLIRQIIDDPQTLSRNRRMLGNLMGHLNSAKRKLEEESVNIEKRQRATSVQQTIKKLEARVQEVMSNQRQWVEKDITPFMDRLVTTIEPSIVWKPKRHNNITNRIISETHVLLNDKRAERRRIDDESIELLKQEMEEHKKSIELQQM